MMFYRIVRKEILENLLSLRFTLSLLLTISLFAATAFVFVDDHQEQRRDYWQRTNANVADFKEQADQLHKVAFHEQHVYSRPKLLSLCAEGFEQSLPRHFSFTGFGIDLPRLMGQSNFALPRFACLDWSFLISLIFSFIAFVFTYDSICGERERGTLRLILTGSVPRATVLLGKYAGLMLTLGIPLLLGLLVSLIVVSVSRVDTFQAGIWVKVLSIVALSFIYLSIFVLLGLFVSARASRPANCMAALLFVWVTLVILIPSLGRIASDRLSHGAAPVDLGRAMNQAAERVDNNCEQYGQRAGARSPNPKDCNPPARARYCNARVEAINEVIESYHNRMLAQAFTGRALTRISPAVVYRAASEALGGTGMRRCISLFRQIRQYQVQLREYVIGEDRDDPDSLHLLFDEAHSVAEWNAISKKPVNFEAVPKFQERVVTLGESLKLAVWDLGLLALFNLAFFAAAFVSFLRYDVR
ncbi:MAG: ABC transporter permease subunit [Sedimentisphaerales bacterium]|nr:ABC transporter permease subunit [Sedimentisphaerales bacterium]